MKFLDPDKSDSDEEFFSEMKKFVEEETDMSYEYLVQEVRRAEMENKVVLVVDRTHHIDVARITLATNPPETIIEFIEKWAPRPEGVIPLKEE